MKIAITLFVMLLQTVCFAARPYMISGQNYFEGPFERACNAFEAKDFAAAADKFQTFLRRYPKHSLTAEAKFLIGVCYFNLCEYGFANTYFSRYLSENASSNHLEEVIKYKFCIAQHFQKGECKRVFGCKPFPKWLSAKQEAKEIYDEIASIYPNDDLAAESMYNKGLILLSDRAFKDAICEFQTVIRRFPRSSLAALSFEGIAKAYLGEAKLEPNNPDLLCLALVNLKKFKLAFPTDERLACLNQLFAIMQNVYAEGFYNMGLFYERSEHKRAAWIYYMTLIKEFPSTSYACLAKERVVKLCLPEA
jgi:TolA-binding protein